jgi:hypothetical protein
MPSFTAFKGLFSIRTQRTLTTFDLSPVKYNNTTNLSFRAAQSRVIDPLVRGSDSTLQGVRAILSPRIFDCCQDAPSCV